MFHRRPARTRRGGAGAAAVALSLMLCLALSACDGTDPTVATIDAAGITTERSQQAISFTDAWSPAAWGETVGVLTGAGSITEGPERITVSQDAGTSWTDATIDGAAVTDASLEVLVAGPKGWLALGRPATGAKERLAVFRSADGRSFTTTGGGVPVPAGATYFAAGSDSGWTVVFREEGKEVWSVATSADGVAWDVNSGPLWGLSAGHRLYLRDLASSGSELMLVGQAEEDTPTTGTEIHSVALTSQDGGLTWALDTSRPAEAVAPYNDGLRAAAWTPQGFAAIGWGWTSRSTRAPQATFFAPGGTERFAATVESALRDGSRANAGNDQLEFSDGTFLAIGNDGDLPRVTTNFRVGGPGGWKDVVFPLTEDFAHRFEEGTVAIPGGFLTFQAVNRTLSSTTEVFFIDQDGQATLRSTFSAAGPPTTAIRGLATVGSSVEGLGFAGSQAALFRRSVAKTFAAPRLRASDEPIRFVGLRAGNGGRIAFGQRQLASSSHGVAWTSTDGVSWTRGSEAVLTTGPEDRTSIHDGLVAGGRYFVAGQATLRSGEVSGAVAVRGQDEGGWTQVSPDAFAGTAETSVVVDELVEAADGSIVAVGSATTDGATSLRIWRSADGGTFTEIPAPPGPEGAKRSPGEAARVGDRLVLSAAEEEASGKKRAVLYESADHGTTWTRVVQDALEADTWIGHDLASDGDEAVLVTTVGTATTSHLQALRRQPDGSWRTIGLESESLHSERTWAADVALAGRQLVTSAETGTATERRPVVVELTLPEAK